MTKENEDIFLEKRFSMDNFRSHYGKPDRRTIYVPRKIGRTNPNYIRTDNFDFAKILDTVNKAADTVQKVGSSVSSAAANVQSATSNIKQSVQNVKSITAPSTQGPAITSQYPGYYNPQQVQSGNIMDFINRPQNSWLLYVVAAALIFFVYKTFKQ